MVYVVAVKQIAPPEESADAATALLGPDGGLITGSDLRIDGGVIAAGGVERRERGAKALMEGASTPSQLFPRLPRPKGLL